MTAVLLTGATGFVGRNVAAALRARGETVVGFAPEDPAVPLEGVRFVAGDVRSAADLDRAMAGVDRVVHAAAATPDAAAEASGPEAIIAVNVGGTAQVMQAARRAGIRRVIGLSSVAVYGFPAGSGALREAETPCRPAALYGITKWAAERTLLRLGALHGIEAAAVRLGPCFGAWEHETGLRPMMSPHSQCVEAARAGRACVLPRDMAADWIDAADAGVAIAALLALPGLPAEAFNLGGGAATTVAAWCAAVGMRYPGFAWRIDAAAATVRYGMAADRAAMDTGRLRAALGWAPETDDLPGRLGRYLQWRESPAGMALCGG